MIFETFLQRLLPRMFFFPSWGGQCIAICMEQRGSVVAGQPHTPLWKPAAEVGAASGKPTRQTGGKTQYPSQPALQKYLHWGLAQMPPGLRPQKDHVNVQWDVRAHVSVLVYVCVQWESGY